MTETASKNGHVAAGHFWRHVAITTMSVCLTLLVVGGASIASLWTLRDSVITTSDFAAQRKEIDLQIAAMKKEAIDYVRYSSPYVIDRGMLLEKLESIDARLNRVEGDIGNMIRLWGLVPQSEGKGG